MSDNVNLEDLARSDFPGIVRICARKLQQTPYLDVGTFLKELAKHELEELVRYANAVAMKIDVPPMLESLVIISEMLAQAEGEPLEDANAHLTSNLMILLTFESLARRGMIEFQRERATLCGEITKFEDLARMK